MALSKQMKDFLKEYKENELTEAQAEEKLNKALGETHVPKAVFNEKSEAEKSAKAQVTEYEKKIKELEKVGDLSEESKKAIEDLKAQLQQQEEDYKSQLTATKRTHALESAIGEAKARDIKSVLPHIDQSKIAWSEDNTLAGGLAEQLEGLRKDKAFLFDLEEAEAKPTKPTFGGQKGTKQGGDPLVSAFAGALGLEE